MTHKWLLSLVVLPSLLRAEGPAVQQIISNSVAANKKDFDAAPNFNWKETDRTPSGSKTYQVTMIEGSPYNRLIAENGKKLSSEREQQELQKQQQVTEKRRNESPDARRQRIKNFEQERTRDNNMINQLTEAFNFTLIGTRHVRG